MKNFLNYKDGTVRTLRDLLNLIKKIQWRNLGWIWKLTTPKYLSYETITLAQYIDIAQTGDYTKLLISGKLKVNEIDEKWEEIVRRDGEANNNNSLQVYNNTFKRYGHFVAEHNEVCVLLTKLLMYVDTDIIKTLRKKGYNIVTTNHRLYTQSLANGFRKASNLLTKVRIEANKLALKASNTQTTVITLPELVANLSVGLGFVVSENIKLAAFNEYKSILKKRNDERSNRKGRLNQ